MFEIEARASLSGGPRGVQIGYRGPGFTLKYKTWLINVDRDLKNTLMKFLKNIDDN